MPQRGTLQSQVSIPPPLPYSPCGCLLVPQPPRVFPPTPLYQRLALRQDPIQACCTLTAHIVLVMACGVVRMSNGSKLTRRRRRRWVASTSNRYEYAKLAQRLPFGLEQRQWDIHAISRPVDGILADPDLGRLRIQPAAKSAFAATHAERDCTEWFARCPESHVSDTPGSAVEEAEAQR